MSVSWDADDDNADGHLDDPADDPRNPPDDEPDYRYEQEEVRMEWHLKVSQLARSGQWQAVATFGTYRLEATSPSRDRAVSELRQVVDLFEGMVGVGR